MTDASDALRKEVEGLKAELETARGRERDLEETRTAMLSLLDDLNENSALVLRAKQEWETTFDAITDPIFIHDAEFRIIRCNRAYQTIAGLPFNEIIGRPYYGVFPKLDEPLEICRKRAQGAVQDDEKSDVELIIPELGKTYRVNDFIERGKEDRFIHILEDVTEAKKAADVELLLYRTSIKMAANFDLDFRFNLLCSTAVKLGHRMAWVGRLDESTKEITPVTHAGLDDGYLKTIRVRYDETPEGNGPTGRAIRYKRAETQDHIATDDRYAPWREAARKRGFKSSAALPIIIDGRVIAVLNVYNNMEVFPQSDVHLLQRLANDGAVHIKNAGLFAEVNETARRLEREMRLTRHFLIIAEATSHTTDAAKLIEQVTRCVKEITGADACLGYLFDKERSAYLPCHAHGLPQETVVLFKTQPFSLKEPQTLLIEQAVAGTTLLKTEATTLVNWAKGLNSAVAIRLRGRDEPLGLLLCLYLNDNRGYGDGFSDRDREILDGISSQISITLDEARHYQETVKRAMELARKVEMIQTMHEIDVTILSALDSTEILEVSTRMIARLMPCGKVTVALVDKVKGGFNFAAGFGTESVSKGDIIPFAQTSATEVLKTGRPQFVSNLADEAGLLPLERKLLAEGYMSHLRVPLTVKGVVVGVLSVGAKRKAAYTPEDLSIAVNISGQIGIALENARLISDLEELFLGTVKTLSEAIDAKSAWTRGHSERVTRFAVEIAREMGLGEEELKRLRLAGLLHDIGKLGTYESILDKPGKLTPEEMAIMKQHPAKGVDILSPISQMSDIFPAIRHHHEYFDGSGYPDGLKGPETPLLARILTVADSVDAMGADRPYRKGKPLEAVIAELKRCSGTQFDPAVVEAFIKTLAKDPGKISA